MTHYFTCIEVNPTKTEVSIISDIFPVEDSLLDEYDQTMFLASLETIKQDQSIVVSYSSEIRNIFVKLYNVIYRSKKFDEWFCVFHSEKTEEEVRQFIYGQKNFEMIMKARIEI